ncbi:diguanylate cyclase domain-containing protein [Craterilacuibacter sp.]|uniref:diguanylate cyclase domain-containing protein n=1 Tax=Craterilacuibacter sp. TaxID=2870909 RepID=UPI003F40A482
MEEIITALRSELAQIQQQLTQAQQGHRVLQEKLDAATDGTGLCIWQGEPQSGRLTVFNLQQFQPEETSADFERWCTTLHPDDSAAVLENYFAHLAGQTPCYEAEYRVVREDGRIVWLWDRGRVLEWDAAGQPIRIMGAHVDITARKTYELRLAHQAHFDPLTGLANRHLMLSRLQTETTQAAQQKHSFVLAMLDIDHFKYFNDAHGHETGDQVLIEAARAMQGQLRKHDLCCRWGGEEFLLLLSEVSITEAQSIIGRIHQGIRQLTLPIPDLPSITASIGFSQHRGNEDYSATLGRADAALMQAKRSGRNKILSE